MPYPNIVFNNLTGSDTAASGAGPATAITGTSAAHTNGVASTTITLTNSPDLSGIAVDGSHSIWMNTATGRQWSMITAKDDVAKTLTVEDSFTIASGSAVSYAIGGKRKLIEDTNSRKVYGSSGAKTGWTISIEYTGTPYKVNDTVTGTMGIATSGVKYIGVGGMPQILWVTKAFGGPLVDISSTFGIGNYFESIQFTRDSSNAFFSAACFRCGVDIVMRNCIIEHTGTYSSLNAFENPANASMIAEFIGCEFRQANGGFVKSGVGGSNDNSYFFNNCRFFGCNYGLYIDRSKVTCINCEFINNSVVGLFAAGTSGQRISLSVTNCTFNGNGDGIQISGNSSWIHRAVTNSIFSNNTGYGINISGTDNKQTFIGWNNFWNNTLGSVTGTIERPLGNNLALDPQYTNAAGLNFTVGANMRGKGYPFGATGNTGYGNTPTIIDLGGSQAAPASGGGGLLLPRAMNGGYSA